MWQIVYLFCFLAPEGEECRASEAEVFRFQADCAASITFQIAVVSQTYLQHQIPITSLHVQCVEIDGTS